MFLCLLVPLHFLVPQVDAESNVFIVDAASQHVSKITAPVLLLVGGDDRRVPPFQSKEFYYALKVRGCTAPHRCHTSPHRARLAE